jgi:hypothetical protein
MRKQELPSNKSRIGKELEWSKQSCFGTSQTIYRTGIFTSILVGIVSRRW